jgi:hypothetical protein
MDNTLGRRPVPRSTVAVGVRQQQATAATAAAAIKQNGVCASLPVFFRLLFTMLARQNQSVDVKSEQGGQSFTCCGEIFHKKKKRNEMRT